eukprot:m.5935 g.5935  ORF g.5935 m.5935 type:complete len:514 (+) comp3766_c0_seq1:220-1761(+)
MEDPMRLAQSWHGVVALLIVGAVLLELTSVGSRPPSGRRSPTVRVSHLAKEGRSVVRPIHRTNSALVARLATPMLKLDVVNAPIGFGPAGWLQHFVTCRAARAYPGWFGWQEATPAAVELYATCPEGGVFWLHSSTSSIARPPCNASGPLRKWHSCTPQCLHCTQKGAKVIENDIEVFIRVVLPVMKGKFVLITTVGDNLNPESVHGAEKLLESPLLERWYTQDMGRLHPKITPIPIGYFIFRAAKWNASDSTNFYRSASFPTRNRFPRSHTVLLDGMNMRTHPSRPVASAEAARCLSKSTVKVPYPLVTPPRLSNKTAALERYDQHTFGISPIGNGVDCYRTWEMLTMGMIPIVQSSSIDVLYNNLPVLVLKEWSELCSVDLEAAHARLAPRFAGVEEKLHLRAHIDMPRLFKVAAQAEAARGAPPKIEVAAADSLCSGVKSLGIHESPEVCGEIVRKMQPLPTQAWAPVSHTHFVWSARRECIVVAAKLSCADKAGGLVPSRGNTVYRIVS